MHLTDVFVITYGTTRWGWKFETGPVQKLFTTQEEAIFYARQAAKKHESNVYVQGKDGRFKKLKPEV